MCLEKLLDKIKNNPELIEFSEVISLIDENYKYRPTTFSNGLGDNVLISEAGKNEGSCKIFAFAKLNNLTKEQTLACFGKYYREDVLNNPSGTDHQNIRSFIKYGWAGIVYENSPLEIK